MSARDVEELVVRARPEGLDETAEGFEEMEEGLEETSSTMEETSSGMQSIQNRLQGAMGAIVAGVAVAVGFLTTQVPIIGELLAGFGAIIEVLGFRLDGLLRPALGGVVDTLFEWANALAEADGMLGLLVDGLLLLGVAIAAIVAGFLLFTNIILPIAGILATVGAGLATLAGIIAGVVASIGAIPIILGVVIAALVAFVAAYLLNWRGTRDKTNEIVGGIFEDVTAWFSNLWGRLTTVASNIASDVTDWFSDLRSRVSTVFTNLISDARSWGRNIINRLIEGIRAVAGRLQSTVENLPVIGGMIEAGVDVGSALVSGDFSVGDAGDAVSGFAADRGITVSNFMDGRRVDDVTGRFGKDKTVRRGG